MTCRQNNIKKKKFLSNENWKELLINYIITSLNNKNNKGVTLKKEE